MSAFFLVFGFLGGGFFNKKRGERERGRGRWEGREVIFFSPFFFWPFQKIGCDHGEISLSFLSFLSFTSLPFPSLPYFRFLRGHSYPPPFSSPNLIFPNHVFFFFFFPRPLSFFLFFLTYPSPTSHFADLRKTPRRDLRIQRQDHGERERVL